jgi:hypothetical protein
LSYSPSSDDKMKKETIQSIIEGIDKDEREFSD